MIFDVIFLIFNFFTSILKIKCYNLKINLRVIIIKNMINNCAFCNKKLRDNYVIIEMIDKTVNLHGKCKIDFLYKEVNSKVEQLIENISDELKNECDFYLIYDKIKNHKFEPIFKSIIKSSIENVKRPMNKSHFGYKIMMNNDIMVKFYGSEYAGSDILYDKIGEFCEI